MKIENFLICDDIRNELGNKHSLMGVYEERIIFNVTPDKKNTWPKSMKIGIFAKINLEDKTPHSFLLKMKYNEQEEKTIGAGDIVKQEKGVSGKMTFAIVNNNFQFTEPGKIKFTFDLLDRDNKVIGSIGPDFDLEIIESVVE